MRRIFFIVESETEGKSLADSVAYTFLADERLSDKEVWALGISIGYDYVPRARRAIRFEWENTEEVKL